jgi:hypothetical protein
MFVIYPEESVPVHGHIIMMLIVGLLVILLTMCFFHRNHGKTLTMTQSADRSFLLKDVLPISAIITAILTPFIQFATFPLVDFNISEPTSIGSTDNAYFSKMIIYNLGMNSAKNVTVSLNAPATLNFLNIISEPFLPHQTKSFSSTDLKAPGKAIYTINQLQPHSRILLNITMNSSKSSPDEGITAHVRTESGIGYHHVFYVTISYLLFSLLVMFFPLAVFKWISISQRKFVTLMIIDIFFIGLLLLATPTNY